ncbi:OsmC family protein [Rhizobium nepotum]|uniref:Stress-induced protein n=1 Tax=Rhizobium nepotum 39/7 TaxID=1368418 RepID=A0ABR5CUX3_9HYPH|nr:OsmC family protein [Rhizobium nepotum]KJF68499.1 stress-induced protein [Rhizobium nepotum 39/7]
MKQLRIKKRPTGAIVALGRLGRPDVVTATGGALTVMTGASEPGFNPVDLLYSSLAACLALSARIAASRMGLLDGFEKVTVHVSGEKADEEPSRIVRFDIRIEIAGGFDEATRIAIAHMAEDICTVSNTLKGDAEFVLSITG